MKSSVLTAPLSYVYSTLSGAKNHLYNWRWLKSQRVDVPVISVGNLTVGGTGKTPMISHLLSWAEQNGLRLGVVSRGYKGEFKGVQAVDPQSPAEIFGDEPTMLARLHPRSPIYVGKNRVLAAQSLLKNHQVDLILADDGFQHRRLQRDLDLVIVDALEPAWHYRPLPWGRARENLTGLARASTIIVNKLNWATPEQQQRLLLTLHTWAPASPVVKAEFCYDEMEELVSGDRQSGEGLKGPVIAVSGVGRPQGFKNLLEESGFEVAEHLSYPDHHSYGEWEVREIRLRQERSGGLPVIITAKDAVKLRVHAHLLEKTYVAHMKLKFDSGIERVYEEINRLVRPRS